MLDAKKLFFRLVRLRQEVAIYEGRCARSDAALKVLHVGDTARGTEFIRRLYGCLPERKVMGMRLSWSAPENLELHGEGCDIVLVEINRRQAEMFRKAGYLTVPEWVEFEREVVRDSEARYAGATKSLKSDLNKIRSSDFKVHITKEDADFRMFYERMYFPYSMRRFGDAVIVKTERKLRGDFEAGFLILLEQDGAKLAGAMIRLEGGVASETTVGVLDGSDDLMRMAVTGALDYHLHEWASKNNVHLINVGHTRPFPLDGVFNNKRKWLMSVVPDYDGVMDMAVRIGNEDSKVIRALEGCPFVFQGDQGLGVFCVHAATERMELKDVKALYKRYWTDGFEYLVVVAPGGYSAEAKEVAEKSYGSGIHLFTGISEAVQMPVETGETYVMETWQ